jgi:hypothetical protein
MLLGRAPLLVGHGLELRPRCPEEKGRNDDADCCGTRRDQEGEVVATAERVGGALPGGLQGVGAVRGDGSERSQPDCRRQLDRDLDRPGGQAGVAGRHIVEITPKGYKALEKAERELETLEDEVLGKLDRSERDQLRDLLAKALEDHSLAISA